MPGRKKPARRRFSLRGVIVAPPDLSQPLILFARDPDAARATLGDATDMVLAQDVLPAHLFERKR